MGERLTDLILLRAKVNGDAKRALDIGQQLKFDHQNGFQEIIATYNADTADLYVYFYLKEPSKLALLDAQSFLQNIYVSLSYVELSRIAFLNPIKGYSENQVPSNRYVVEMDPELGWMEELFDWYDQEHLPGLANVPGCVRAIRCLNLDHSPYSYAFYDLTSTNVLGCEAWLKVRHTAWSDRVRPHFTNTKRTMFEFI